MPCRRPAVLLAAATLLALATACTGGGEGSPTGPAPTTRPASASDTAAPDGGMAGPGASDGSGASDGGGADDGGSDLGGEAPPVLHPRLLLVTDPSSAELTAEELAGLLGARLEAEAECDGPLALPAGDPQTCGAPAGPESPAGGKDVVWIAQGVQVPAEGGGAAPAVLFTLDVALDDEAALALGPERMLSALPMGSMYGAEPVAAQELGSDVLRTLSAEHALTAQVPGYTAVDCAADLDFSRFEPVTCTGQRDGAPVELWVLPGVFAGADQGLLVSSPVA